MLKFLLKTGAVVAAAGLVLGLIKKYEDDRAMDEEDWDYEIQKTPETDADDAAKETPTDTAEVKSAPEETAKPEPAEESTDEEQSLPAILPEEEPVPITDESVTAETTTPEHESETSAENKPKSTEE